MGVSNQHSLPSSSWDVRASGLLIRKGRKAREEEEEEAEPKMLIDFPRSSQQSTIDSVTSNNRNSTASFFCRLKSLKMRHWQDRAPSKTSKGGSFLFIPASGSPRLSLACSSLILIRLIPHMTSFLCVSVSAFKFHF